MKYLFRKLAFILFCLTEINLSLLLYNFTIHIYTHKKGTYSYLFAHFQGRQSVLKSGRSERGGERNFGVAPKNVLLKGYFCPNFRGGAEKVVVHMHWLTWLLWRP